MRKTLFFLLTIVFLSSLCATASKKMEEERDEAFYDSLRSGTANYESSTATARNEGRNGEMDYQMPDSLAALSDNENVVGWIYIENTNINYPIAQSKEDNEYFLYRDIYGNSNRVGSIYLDAMNEIDEVGLHLVYGHHMRNGTMFHDISKFKDNRYLEAHQNIIIWTKKKAIKLLPVYCYAGEADGDYRQNFKSSEEWQEFIKEKTGINISANNVFVFITCSYGSKDERTYLVCKEAKRE